MAQIRAGIGGWVYPPWRGAFYPHGLRQADELAFASRALGVIEINSTYQSFQSPDVFSRWASQTPDDFVFTVKASRLCTNRKVLADVGPWIERFFESGPTALGAKLGPILWQFMPTKIFDPTDFETFLGLLPTRREGVALRHSVEVRHPSFDDPAFVNMCADRGVAICIADHPTAPLIEAQTADFAYVRLMRGSDDEPVGYPRVDLKTWAGRLRRIADERASGEVFAFFINAGKSRAPVAAMALDEILRSI